MKKSIVISVFGAMLLCCLYANAQTDVYAYDDDPSFVGSCTSVMVGKKASTDGSVMTAHACDSYYRTYVTMEPRKHFEPGEKEDVYYYAFRREEPWDNRIATVTGSIVPPKQDTYRFLNTAYPCMNEKQVAIGETTFDGRLELINRKGIFWIEELQRIGLEYAATAREAIEIMGKVAEEYGYCDWGECLTVADKNEVWQFEINGPGEGEPGAIWAAQRIPDNHVGISANIARIGAIDFDDPANFMWSKNVKEKAKQYKVWDGKGPLVFWKLVGDGRPFSIREYMIFKELAPKQFENMELDADGLPKNWDEFPFSIVPEKKVSPEQMFSFYRMTYEGTGRYDVTDNLKIKVHRREKIQDSDPYPFSKYNEYDEEVVPISPFMSADVRAMLNKFVLKEEAEAKIADRKNLKKGQKVEFTPVVKNRRTVAVIQCSYSWVAQCREWLPDAVGGIVYFAYDNAAQSPRFPIYAGQTTLPHNMMHCGQNEYRPEAAVWAFRETNRLATIYWDKTRKVLEPWQSNFEKLMMMENKVIEQEAAQLIKDGKDDQAAELLNTYNDSFFTMVSGKWKELKARILEIFVRSM